MRIINIIDTLDPNSGVFDVVNTFGDNFKKKDIQIDYLYFYDTKRSEKNKLMKKGHNLLKLDIKELIYSSKKTKEKISNFIDIGNEDSIIVHNHVLLFSNFIMPYFSSEKISLCVGHAHSASLSNSIFKRIRNWMFLININKFYDVFFGCSSKSIDTWFGKKNYEKKRVIIPNPIDCTLVSNAVLNYNNVKKQDVIILGTVGRIVKEKNQEFLFDIIQDIDYEFPEKKIVLKIIGEGPLKKKLIKKYKSKYNNLNIIFYDYMKKEKLYQEILTFNYFLLPSKKEGLGITLIESQMLGIYSIASYGVPIEADLGNLDRLHLSKGMWSKKIINLIKKEEKINSNIDNIYCMEKASDVMLKQYLYYLG